MAKGSLATVAKRCKVKSFKVVACSLVNCSSLLSKSCKICVRLSFEITAASVNFFMPFAATAVSTAVKFATDFTADAMAALVGGA